MVERPERRRRSILPLLIVNILLSAIVAFAVISYVNSNTPPPAAQQIVVTVPVLVTATPNPNAGPQVIVVTATPQPGTVILPTGLIETTEISRTTVPIATIDPTLIESSIEIQGTVTALPANCIPYSLAEGDFPGSIAAAYDISVADLLAVNGLTEETSLFLQIGQVLIVPLEGCELTAASVSATQTATLLPPPTQTPIPTTPSPSPSPTNTEPPTNTPTEAPMGIPTATPTQTLTPSLTPTETLTPTITPSPTNTLPPTATNAQVVIRTVTNAGDVTAESIEIINNGQTVNLGGWTLEDADGNVYTFPTDRLVFQNGVISVFSRVGDDTPIALFWDRQQPVLSRGETITLYNREGRAQSNFTVPGN